MKTFPIVGIFIIINFAFLNAMNSKLPNSNTLKELARTLSETSIASDGSASSSSNQRPFLERQMSLLNQAIKNNKSVSQYDLKNTVSDNVDKLAVKAAQIRYEMEKVLDVEDADSKEYQHCVNVIAKSLLYQVLLEQIYPNLKNRLKKMAVDLLLLKDQVKANDQAKEKARLGKQQPLSREEVEKHSKTQEDYEILGVRMDKLKKSMEQLKDDISLITEKKDIDEMLAEIINRPDPVYTRQVESTTYKSYVLLGYEKWRIDFPAEAHRRIRKELASMRSIAAYKPVNPNKTVALLDQYPSLANLSSFKKS